VLSGATVFGGFGGAWQPKKPQWVERFALLDDKVLGWLLWSSAG
jgi:hypothetical protein